MNIHDIIEKWHVISSNYAQHGYTAAVHARDFEEIRDDLAIALEEVALIEAERVAARAFITDRASGVGFAVRKYDEWVDACKATDRYRKEIELTKKTLTEDQAEISTSFSEYRIEAINAWTIAAKVMKNSDVAGYALDTLRDLVDGINDPRYLAIGGWLVIATHLWEYSDTYYDIDYNVALDHVLELTKEINNND